MSSRPLPLALAGALGLAAAGLALSPSPARAQGSIFTDPVDGAFDVDRFLASRYGFVPIVMPITEPALGLGAAGGPVFLHGSMAGETGPTGRRIPPSVSALVGFATSNGSWGGFAGHLGHWKEGTIRSLTGGGYASLELAAYPVDGTKLDFRIEAAPLIEDFSVAIPGSDLMVGARYVLSATRVHLEGDGAVVGQLQRDVTATLSGLGPVLRWDSRDSIFSPDAGARAELAASWFAPWLGSDYDFWNVRIRQNSYGRIAPWLGTGLRLDLQLTGGDAPFWAKPFIQLRGIPAMRYQGTQIFVAETEERIDFTPRWSAVVFGGYGVAAGVPRPVTAWNVGSGFRYLLARQFGVRAGLDVARGPEDWAVYVVFGNAWM
jgi:hypothetical protein